MFKMFKKSYKKDEALVTIESLIQALKEYKAEKRLVDNTEIDKAIKSLRNMRSKITDALINAQSDDENKIILRHIGNINSKFLAATGDLRSSDEVALLSQLPSFLQPPSQDKISPAPKEFIGFQRGVIFIKSIINAILLGAFLTVSVGALMGGIALLPINMPLAVCAIVVSGLSILAAAIGILSHLPTILFCGNNCMHSRITALHESNTKDYNQVKDYINGLPLDDRQNILGKKTEIADQRAEEIICAGFALAF